MLLFKKKDLLVVISKSGDTVQFTKPLKDILKYQHRYNYKFKMYENGKVTVADDYVINGETLTVLFGSATVSYTSEGATYTEGSGGGSGSGCECGLFTVTFTQSADGYTVDKTFSEITQLISDGKKPVAYASIIDDPEGILTSNQYIYYENTGVVFMFNYSYPALGGSGLKFVNKGLGMTSNGTITERQASGTIRLFE